MLHRPLRMRCRLATPRRSAAPSWPPNCTPRMCFSHTTSVPCASIASAERLPARAGRHLSTTAAAVLRFTPEHWHDSQLLNVHVNQSTNFCASAETRLVAQGGQPCTTCMYINHMSHCVLCAPMTSQSGNRRVAARASVSQLLLLLLLLRFFLSTDLTLRCHM
jgi:hypothetical protein